jgi:hypothetical protein
MAVGEPSAALDAILAEFDTSFMQLHTGDPGAAGTSNVEANVAGRSAVTFGAAETNAGTRRRRNTAIIRWDAGDVTGTVAATHWSLWSASSAGTFQRSGSFSATINASAGQPIEIQVGGLEVNAGPLAS